MCLLGCSALLSIPPWPQHPLSLALLLLPPIPYSPKGHSLTIPAWSHGPFLFTKQHTHIAISFEGYALFIQSSDFYSFCYPPLPSHCPTPTPPNTHTFILLGPQVGGQSGAEKFFIGWSWCRWFHALLLGLVFLICGI